MDASKENLNGFFQDTVGIPRDKVKYYVGWLNRFLQFYNGELDDISEDDLRAFGTFLENKGYEAWQVTQAQEAVFTYVERFLQKRSPLRIPRKVITGNGR